MGDIIGRDKYEQKGMFSKISVDNRKISTDKKWYEKWWGQIIIGVVVIIIGALLIKLTRL